MSPSLLFKVSLYFNAAIEYWKAPKSKIIIKDKLPTLRTQAIWGAGEGTGRQLRDDLSQNSSNWKKNTQTERPVLYSSFSNGPMAPRKSVSSFLKV